MGFISIKKLSEQTDMEEKLYSFAELHKQYKIYPNLIEYLNIDVIKKGRISYINQESFDKIMAFKSEHPNTREFFQKLTFMKKYGTDNPMKVKSIHDKAKQTILDKFGVENVSQSKEIKEKKIETLQSHFGKDVINPMNVQEIVNNVKENWKNKTQDEIDSYTNKTKATKKELYGNENYNNAESISKTKLARTQEEIDEEIRKVKATKKEKYGNENYNNREQITLTMINKCGKGSKTNSKKAMETKFKNNTVVCKTNYKYDNLLFASSWEVYYYIYQKEILHNDIKKGKWFKYDYNEDVHIYECDFEVNGENIEIKGNQLLDSKGNLKQMKTREWDMCKQKCMKDNNVIIISKEEIKPIIKVVQNTFGKDYINQFRLK